MVRMGGYEASDVGMEEYRSAEERWRSAREAVDMFAV